MNRIFVSIAFPCTLWIQAFIEIVGQPSQSTNKDIQQQLYQGCSKVWTLFNEGKDLQASKLADSIMDNNKMDFLMPIWGYLCNYKANGLHHAGNFYLSKKYYQLASLYAVRQRDKSLLEHTVNNYGGLMIESFDSAAAARALKSRIFNDNILVGKPLFIALQLNLAILALDGQDTSSADKHFRLLQTYRDIINPNDPVWVMANRSYGKFLFETGRISESLFFLLKAKNQSLLINSFNHYQTGICNMAVGEYFTKICKKDSATFYFNEAKRIISSKTSKDDTTSGQPQYEMVLLECLLKIGEFKHMSAGSLNEAYDLFKLAINRILTLSHSVTSETSRFVIADKGRSSFNKGIACALKLYENTHDKKYLEEAFNWSLQAKSLSLNWLVEKDLIYPMVGIPSNLITNLQNNRQILERILGDTLCPVTFVPMDSIIHVLRDYEKSEKLIQNKYTLIREASQSNPLAQLMSDRSLEKGNYLGYYELDSIIVVFGQNRKEKFFTLIQKDSQLLAEIRQFKTILKDKPLSSYGLKEVETYMNLSYSLFSKLVLPFLGKSRGHNLVIHPDGILDGLPFEALVTRHSNAKLFKSLPYLMNEYSIRYVSTSMLNNEQKPAKLNGLTILSCKSSTGIPESVNEISEVQKEYPASTLHFIDDQTIGNDRILGNTSRIHISTHLVINNPDPMQSGLACYQSGSALLRFRDILYIDLTGKHVFINGCESGNGPLNHGEGLMSLGLAFSVAGCSSVIGHFWNVSDRAAVELARNFYKNISLLPDYQALQKAKIDYLKSTIPGNDHPFYWSGIVCYSKSQSDQKNVLVIVSVLGLLVSGFLIYLLLLKRKRR